MTEKAGFGMILSETLKTGFVASMLIYIHVNADPIHKPGSCDMHIDKKRYDSELPYQRPDPIEMMEIEIDFTTSTNVHTSFYISVRECLD